MISAAAHRELINLDTNKMFKVRSDWSPENCMLNRDFFKHLGNMSYEELSKLAKHLLNQTGGKRMHSYPKVTIKSISLVQNNCFSTKEWVERRKWKNLVIKEFHNIDPTFGLLNSRNEVISENWKAFKKERLFSSATMDILLERPGEAYFGQAKSTYTKHKMCSKLSHEAYNFFKMFLDHKSKFERPSATAYYRPYELTRSYSIEWPSKSWTEETIKRLSLKVIDFRSLPGVEKKEASTIENPFFFEVLSAMQKTKKPALEDVPSWLFICGDDKEEA